MIFGTSQDQKPTTERVEVHVLLSPPNQVQLIPEIIQSGVAYLRTLDSDVQRTVSQERLRLLQRSAVLGDWSPETHSLDEFFEDYRPFEEHRQLLRALADRYPSLVTLRTIGKTNEGEDIISATVTAPTAPKDVNGTVANRPAILAQSGAHAREWLATPVTLYILKRLCEGYRNDPEITKLLDNYTWHLVSVVNADGYKFTWDGNRLWRKNRRRNTDGSFGVDLNRNYDGSPFCGSGGSRIPSSDTYCGTGPASEPETQAVSSLFRQHPEIRAAFDLHTYSQLLLFPWQYTYDKLPAEDLAEFRKQGSEMQRVIKSLYGVNYDPIQGSDLYPHSGGMIDFAWSNNRAYGYTFEGRGNSFIMPPQNIRPAAEEQTQAIFWLAHHLLSRE